jgi:hypothetical protein
LFGDYGFKEWELTGVYFGPKCTLEDRTDLLKLLMYGLQHVDSYDMLFDPKQGKMTARSLAR